MDTHTHTCGLDSHNTSPIARLQLLFGFVCNSLFVTLLSRVPPLNFWMLATEQAGVLLQALQPPLIKIVPQSAHQQVHTCTCLPMPTHHSPCLSCLGHPELYSLPWVMLAKGFNLIHQSLNESATWWIQGMFLLKELMEDLVLRKETAGPRGQGDMSEILISERSRGRKGRLVS